MNKWLIFLIAIGIIYFGLTMFIGFAGSLLVTVSMAVFILGLMKYLGLPVPFPFNKKWAGYITLGAFAVVFISLGWFTMIQDMLITGTVTTIPTVTQPTPTPVGACVVSDELRGKQATITVKIRDVEQNTVGYTSGSLYAQRVSDGAWVEKAKAIGSTGTDVNFAAGEVYDIYVTNATATSAYSYTDAYKGYCVNALEMSDLELTGHTGQSESNMAITGYDSTGASTMTAGDTSLDDYQIDMAADDYETFWLKLKNAGTNTGYNFCGWAYWLNDQVDTINILEPGFSTGYLPKYLRDAQIRINETAALIVNATGYEVVLRTSPILIKEGKWIKHEFEVETGTTAPAETGAVARTLAAADLIAIIALDCAYDASTEGVPILDHYVHSATEGNVGLTETVASPLGKQVGTIIEIT